jgi:hypothetical protein
MYAHSPVWVVAASGLAFGAVVTTLAAVARRVALRSALAAGVVAGLGYAVGVLLLQRAGGLSG